MDIVRSSPDVGYFSQEIYREVNFAQAVRVGAFVHYSGVVAADAAGASIASGDFPAQMEEILNIYRRLLAADQMSFDNLVSVTIFTTDMAALVDYAPSFKLAFGDHPPAATWVEVKALSHPDHMVEVVVIAAG